MSIPSMLNMKNTILSANVLHTERNLLIANLVMTAISCGLHVAQVVFKLVKKVNNWKAKRDQEQNEMLKILKDLQAQQQRGGQAPGSQSTVPTGTQNPATNAPPR